MINESLAGNVPDTEEASKDCNSAWEGQKRLYIGAGLWLRFRREGSNRKGEEKPKYVVCHKALGIEFRGWTWRS